MLQVLLTIFPLFLIILASALVRRFLNLGERWIEPLNQFALKIGLPSLIFLTLSQAEFSFGEYRSLILTNSLFIILLSLATIAIGRALKLRKKTLATILICVVFNNIAYLGIPILGSVWGKEVLPTVSLIVATHLFWIFTLTVGYLEYYQEGEIKKAFRDLVTNPLLISVVLGLLMGGVEIPSFMSKVLEMLSSTVTPVALIVIGLFLGQSRVGKVSEWVPVLLFSILTLVILPLGFYLFSGLTGLEGPHLYVSLLEIGMPVAITPFVLAGEYDLDKKFITRSIALSTTLSIISLPVWIGWIL